MTPYAFIRALPADLPEPEITADDDCLTVEWWACTKRRVRAYVFPQDKLRFSTAWVGGCKRLTVAQIAEKIRGLKDVH